MMSLNEHSPLLDVLEHFRGDRDTGKARLADCLGVSKQYISQLNEREPLPRGLYLELRYVHKPELFDGVTRD